MKQTKETSVGVPLDMVRKLLSNVPTQTVTELFPNFSSLHEGMMDMTLTELIKDPGSFYAFQINTVNGQICIVVDSVGSNSIRFQTGFAPPCIVSSYFYKHWFTDTPVEPLFNALIDVMYKCSPDSAQMSVDMLYEAFKQEN